MVTICFIIIITVIWGSAIYAGLKTYGSWENWDRAYGRYIIVDFFRKITGKPIKKDDAKKAPQTDSKFDALKKENFE